MSRVSLNSLHKHLNIISASLRKTFALNCSQKMICTIRENDLVATCLVFGIAPVLPIINREISMEKE